MFCVSFRKCTVSCLVQFNCGARSISCREGNDLGLGLPLYWLLSRDHGSDQRKHVLGQTHSHCALFPAHRSFPNDYILFCFLKRKLNEDYSNYLG